MRVLNLMPIYPLRLRTVSFSLLALLTACAPASGSDESSATQDEDSTATGEELGSEETSEADESSTESEDTGVVEEIGLELRDNPDMTIAPFADIDAPDATEVRLEAWRDGTMEFSRVVTDIDDAAAQLQTFVWGLEADTTYNIVAEADLPSGLGRSSEVEYTTGALPEGMPTLTVSNHDPARAHDGLVFFSVRAADVQTYLGVNPEGTVVWYHSTGGTGNRLNGDLKVNPDGTYLLQRPGGVQIIQPWGEVVAEFDTDYHHDVTVMANGNLMVLGRVNQDIDVTLFGGVVSVQVDTLEEYEPDGTLVRTWNAADHLDTDYYPSLLSQEGPPYDWTHGNAAFWDEENSRVLLSARSLHWVVAVDWPSGDVDWVMGPGGDFTLNGPDEDWFYAQHAPMADGDGRMVVYDNGNERPDGELYTRGIVIDYDETAMTAEVTWEHTITPQTTFLGDADRISNGNILMCAGGILSTVVTPRLIEASGDAAADVVWELGIADGGNVFRATHLDAL